MEEIRLLKKGQSAANMMHRLPREVIVNIPSRLPFSSFKHLDEAAGNDPSFILESNWLIPDQLYFIDFFDNSEGKVISKKLQAINSPTNPMFLIDSCNGLLCMHDPSRRIFICNPFTRLYIELPKLVKYPSLVGHLVYGFHQTTKEYKAEVQILTIGSPCWRNLGTIPYRFILSKPKALVHWRFRWLSKPKKHTTATLLISFDLDTERFQEVPKPDCRCGSDKCFGQLMVVRGCLSAIAFHDNYGERLENWVMKEYGVKQSWIKEFSIGAYCLPTTLMQQEIIQSNAYLRPNLSVRFLTVLKSGEILL
ncbi:Detected protein of unknown function [Hibiscus syriacus]|uniref:Post-SET domain-containing protein n=1 Tax=Hibiscus syriacus TaxID=106335 RepID=A0A6A2ZGZ1_HIBSY|nr:Detected protein of unknown function [Hibiscus syriacus]